MKIWCAKPAAGIGDEASTHRCLRATEAQAKLLAITQLTGRSVHRLLAGWDRLPVATLHEIEHVVLSLDAQERREFADQHERTWAVLHHEPLEDTPTAAGRGVLLGASSAWCADWMRTYGQDHVFCGYLHHAPFARGGSWAARP